MNQSYSTGGTNKKKLISRVLSFNYDSQMISRVETYQVGNSTHTETYSYPISGEVQRKELPAVAKEPDQQLQKIQEEFEELERRSKELFDRDYAIFFKIGFSNCYNWGGGTFTPIRNRLFKQKFGSTCLILSSMQPITNLFQFQYSQGKNPLRRVDLSLEGGLNLIHIPNIKGWHE
tara:strand:+ start:1311 stop:1838 length:528 start_codon:yes stop_codon:yes gene_type:complete